MKTIVHNTIYPPFKACLGFMSSFPSTFLTHIQVGNTFLKQKKITRVMLSILFPFTTSCEAAIMERNFSTFPHRKIIIKFIISLWGNVKSLSIISCCSTGSGNFTT